MKDLVRIIGICLEKESMPSEMNVASGTGTSILNLVDTLSELNPEMQQPVFSDSRPGDIHTSVADVSLMQQVISPGKLISLKEGLS